MPTSGLRLPTNVVGSGVWHTGHARTPVRPWQCGQSACVAERRERVGTNVWWTSPTKPVCRARSGSGARRHPSTPGAPTPVHWNARAQASIRW